MNRDWETEKEKEIKKYVNDNGIEYSWNGLTLYVYLDGWQMSDFANVISPNLFDEGAFDCEWYGDGIRLNMTEINDMAIGINLYNVFECTENDINIYDTFWEFVKKVDWKNRIKSNDRYYETVQRRCKEELSPFLRKTFRDVHRELVNKLYHECIDYCNDMSDDSYYDLRSHIVGLGRNIYYQVRENPELIIDFKDKYKECFGYCFM